MLKRTRTPKLTPIDLSKADDCQHPDIKLKQQYLARIDTTPAHSRSNGTAGILIPSMMLDIN